MLIEQSRLKALTQKRMPLGILFLLFLTAWAICAYIKFSRDKEDRVLVVYTAIFEVDAALADQFHVGERLIDAKGKEDAGEIISITREAAKREDAFGVYSLPERVTLAIELLGEGKRGKDGARVGTLTPRVGEPLYLLGRARLEGLCVKVRTI